MTTNDTPQTITLLPYIVHLKQLFLSLKNSVFILSRKTGALLL